MPPRSPHVPPLLLRLALAAVAGAALSCGTLGAPEFTGNRSHDGIGPYRDLGAVSLCLGDRRLAGGQSAAGGFCTPAAQAPAACTSDADCRSRERCVCGACTVAFCSEDADCGSAFRCNQATGGCERVCDDATPCAPGEECSAGRCIAPCSPGTQEAEEVCQTGEVCSRTRQRCVVIRCDGPEDPACQADERCALQREPRQVREPFVLADENEPGRFWLWAELTDADGESAIYRARSDNGTDFRIEPAEPVLAPEAGWEGRRVGAPALVRWPDGGYTLLYAGGDGEGIGRATSADGAVFEREPAPLLVPAEAWEAGRIDSPTAAPDGDDLLVVYEIGNGAGLGLARGPRDGALVRAGAPLLLPTDVGDEVLWRAVDRLGGPLLLFEAAAGVGARYRLFFHARGVETSSFGPSGGEPAAVAANYSIGYAAGDLSGGELVLSVFPFNPVLDRTVEFVRHLSERMPAVVVTPLSPEAGIGPSAYRLYYVGADADLSGDTGLGVAQSPAPDLPFPGEPPAPGPSDGGGATTAP